MPFQLTLMTVLLGPPGGGTLNRQSGGGTGVADDEDDADVEALVAAPSNFVPCCRWGHSSLRDMLYEQAPPGPSLGTRQAWGPSRKSGGRSKKL